MNERIELWLRTVGSVLSPWFWRGVIIIFILGVAGGVIWLLSVLNAPMDNTVLIHSFYCEPKDNASNETYVRIVTPTSVGRVNTSAYGVCHLFNIKPGIMWAGGAQ